MGVWCWVRHRELMRRRRRGRARRHCSPRAATVIGAMAIGESGQLGRIGRRFCMPGTNTRGRRGGCARTAMRLGEGTEDLRRAQGTFFFFSFPQSALSCGDTKRRSWSPTYAQYLLFPKSHRRTAALQNRQEDGGSMYTNARLWLLLFKAPRDMQNAGCESDELGMALDAVERRRVCVRVCVGS